MAKAVVEALEVVDVDDEETQMPAGERRFFDTFPPQMFEPATVERAGQRVAAGARQKILVALAVGEKIEHVHQARRPFAAFARQLDVAEVKPAEHLIQQTRPSRRGRRNRRGAASISAP